MAQQDKTDEIPIKSLHNTTAWSRPGLDENEIDNFLIR